MFSFPYNSSSYGSIILSYTATIIIYIILIFLLHLLWNYIKDNYSTKKTKDLVNSQLEKYKKMLSESQRPNSIEENSTDSFISNEEKQEMADELSALLTQ